MWVIVHALSGLALGVLAPIGLGYLLVAALLLHLVLDLVPHWDYTGISRGAWAAIADVLSSVAVVTALAIILRLPAAALAAAVMSALPDLDVFDAVLPGKPRRRWFPSHWRVFPHGRASARVGVTVQVSVVVASVLAVIVRS